MARTKGSKNKPREFLRRIDKIISLLEDIAMSANEKTF